MYDLLTPLLIVIAFISFGFGLGCYVMRNVSYTRLKRRVTDLERLLYTPAPVYQQPRIRYRSIEDRGYVTEEM